MSFLVCSVPIQIELSVERHNLWRLKRIEQLHRRYTADTHRYFVDPSVCLCKATANPKKLPLVFPSLITGNRESILNPLQVRVTQNTAKAPWRYRLGAMFIPCAQLSLPAAARSTPDWKIFFPLWGPCTGYGSKYALHWETSIPSRLVDITATA